MSRAADPTQRRLSSALGVEVLGLDLRRDPIGSFGSQLLDLLDLLAREHLVVVRGQDLTLDDQIRILTLFGCVDDELGLGMPSYYVSNARADGHLGEVELLHGTGARRTLRRVSTTERGVSPARAIGIDVAG